MSPNDKKASSRVRSKNWSEEEKRALVDLVSVEYHSLFGNHSNQVTEKSKGELWAQITERVNEIGGQNRTVTKVRDEFRHLKSEVKKKAAARMKELGKTGGGERDDSQFQSDVEAAIEGLKGYEKTLVGAIGYTAIIGITGGVDTAVSQMKDTQERATENEGNESVVFEMSEGDEVMKSQLQQTTPRHHSTTSKHKNSVKSSSDVSTSLLEVQKGILEQLKRIADASEEKLRLKRIKLSL